MAKRQTFLFFLPPLARQKNGMRRQVQMKPKRGFARSACAGVKSCWTCPSGRHHKCWPPNNVGGLRFRGLGLRLEVPMGTTTAATHSGHKWPLDHTKRHTKQEEKKHTMHHENTPTGHRHGHQTVTSVHLTVNLLQTAKSHCHQSQGSGEPEKKESKGKMKLSKLN